MWLKIDTSAHPRVGASSLLEIEEDIFNACVESGVLVARGSWFRTEKDKPLAGLFFRATFASATPENMNVAIERFGKAVRESFGRN
jgi:aromatic amino acid aminotransferase I / 2-aminoadipate transaminase